MSDKIRTTACLIVPATQAEVPQIAALEELCFSDPWSEAVLTESVGHPLYRFLAAMDEKPCWATPACF